MNPVGESQQVWISVENGQNQSEFGLNFSIFLVWIGSEFCQYQSEHNSGKSEYGSVPSKLWVTINVS